MKKIAMAKEAGFDYFEYNVVQLSKLSDDEYKALYDRVHELGFYAEAMCLMLPSEIKVTGTDIDLRCEVAPYLQHVLPRAQGLGCRKFVFGSSRSRNMPEGFWGRRKAYAQIVAFLRLASEMVEPFDIEIVIEPCPNPDNNILNFVSEGHYVMCLTNRHNVHLLADTYLMQANYESLREIYAYSESLHHLHISAPDRMVPYEGDGFDYSELFRVIRESGYDRTITIEAFHPEDGWAERMKEAYALLKAGLID